MKTVSLAFSILLAGNSLALAEGERACRPLSEVRAESDAARHQWIELSREQWYFIAGIYSLNPNTPAGLPFGNKAVLITEGDAPNMGIILFVDGPLACIPMPIPADILSELRNVGVKINHEGAL